MSQVAHQGGVYPSFHIMKQLGFFLVPSGWDASPLQGYFQHSIFWYPFILVGGERHCESKCLAQEHDIMSSARAWTWIIWSHYMATLVGEILLLFQLGITCFVLHKKIPPSQHSWSHGLNPLLTKFVQSRCLDISLILFLHT